MQDKVIFLTSDQMGAGERTLGETVLESFFALLKQQDPPPAAVFAVNRGVLALTRRSLVSVHLREMSVLGVPVLACRTCVEFYGIDGQLVAGEVSSMGAFVALAARHEVLTIA